MPGQPSRQRHSRAGLIGLVTGVLGAISALVLLYWPPQIAEGPVSYPFTTSGFLIAQAWFFVHHVGLGIALTALAVSFWMLQFATLGWSLHAEWRRSSPARQPCATARVG